MADEQAVALYELVKRLAEGMSAREAALNSSSCPSHSASRLVSTSPREAMEKDFRPPIEGGFQGPIAELKSIMSNARELIQEVGRYPNITPGCGCSLSS